MIPREARGPIRWWLNLWGFDGITLPPFGIYIRREKLGDQRAAIADFSAALSLDPSNAGELSWVGGT